MRGVRALIAIKEGNFIDVMEIDAASNNGDREHKRTERKRQVSSGRQAVKKFI